MVQALSLWVYIGVGIFCEVKSYLGFYYLGSSSSLQVGWVKFEKQGFAVGRAYFVWLGSWDRAAGIVCNHAVQIEM